MYKFSEDDGYGDVAYIGFKFVYAAATATAGSGKYSTTGAGGVNYEKKNLKFYEKDSFGISYGSDESTYLTHI